MNDITTKQLLEAATPLIKLLNELHPHHKIIVTGLGAELLEGQVACRTEKYLKD